jgi:3-hydroxyacyl-CoA dehydrogenase
VKSPQAIKIVAIVGNGRMGTGISQVFASRGMDVRLIGRSEESLANRERYLDDLRRAGVPEK